MAYLDKAGLEHLWTQILARLGDKMDADQVATAISDAMSIIPEVTEADNGKVLMVVDGAYQLVSLNLSVDANGVVSV